MDFQGTPPLCPIAQIAIENALILLHDDRDFDSVAAVAPIFDCIPFNNPRGHCTAPEYERILDTRGSRGDGGLEK